MLLVPLTLLRPSSSATFLKAGKVGENFQTSHIWYSDHLHDCKSFQCKFLFTGRGKHRFVHFVFTSIVQKVAIFNSQMRKNLCYEYCNDPFVKASRLAESSSRVLKSRMTSNLSIHDTDPGPNSSFRTWLCFQTVLWTEAHTSAQTDFFITYVQLKLNDTFHYFKVKYSHTSCFYWTSLSCLLFQMKF